MYRYVYILLAILCVMTITVTFLPYCYETFSPHPSNLVFFKGSQKITGIGGYVE